MDFSLLLLFIPTSFLISVSPGMCMTLALTLGMSIGVRKTTYMMWGEMLGVALVSLAAVLGVAALMLNYPSVFTVLKWLGGAYLVWTGVSLWQSKGKLALSNNSNQVVSRRALFSQGFITAVANPKGWAFTAALLPPFINQAQSLAPQLGLLVMIMLVNEFICMMLYASGGRGLKSLLAKNENVALMNKLTGSLMIAVGVWLALG